MKTFKKLILYLFSLPNNVVAVPLVLMIHLFWGKDLRLENWCVCTTLKEDSWPCRSWYRNWMATTFGHAIMYRFPEAKAHEHIHVEQFEVEMMKSCLMGLTAFFITSSWWALWAIWSAGITTYLVSSWAAAWLVGGSVYWDSVHEEAAYAVDEYTEDGDI